MTDNSNVCPFTVLTTKLYHYNFKTYKIHLQFNTLKVDGDQYFSGGVLSL